MQRPLNEIVSEILGANDIVDVLSASLQLKPAGGSRFKALCPFHVEKTPSFTVNRDRQTYKCFGCEKGGDAITFLQEDKDFQKIGELLALHSQETRIVDLKLGKPLNPDVLYRAIRHHNGNAKVINSLENIKKEIDRSSDKEHLWLIIGSHYLAGEAYQCLLPQDNFSNLIYN